MREEGRDRGDGEGRKLIKRNMLLVFNFTAGPVKSFADRERERERERERQRQRQRQRDRERERFAWGSGGCNAVQD